MPSFRYLSTVLLALGLSCALSQASAQAADFSANPFAQSERALMNSRASATLLNLGATTSRPASPTNIIIRQSLPGQAVDDTTSSAGVFSPYYGGFRRPFVSPYLGYGGWGPGSGYGYGYGVGFNPMMAGLAGSAGEVPFYTGAFAPYAYGPGLGGWGYGGMRGFRGWRGYGGYGFGGFGYGGYGWGGWSPGAAALSMGAFGNWMDNEELGEMGSLGYVDNGPPSKASGNYYAPSTKDPTAAGNYYAGDNSAVNMPIKPYTTPKDYWGSSGSPLPKDINKVPW